MSEQPLVDRRVFIKGAVAGTVGILTSSWINLTLANPTRTVKQDDLAAGFLNPPDSARPWVYWFWINGNLSREGITADLEAMHRVGIGGVLLMEVDGSPKGAVAFGTDEWKEMFRFACQETSRLGLEININNGAGWTGSGGPWNSQEMSMQKVVFAELYIDGAKQIHTELPHPNGTEKGLSYYRDIAVIAFPTPVNTTYRTEDILFKAGYETGATPPKSNYKGAAYAGFNMLPVAVTPAPLNSVIDKSSIVDLTTGYQAGILSWEVPPGNWTILRFGHSSTGTTNHPAPTAGEGLECDKMSKEAVTIHFNKFMGTILALAGPLAGKTLVSTHVDSWEVGCQNWTKAFPEEFKKRAGYEIESFLPALTGRVIGSAEETERFLWDMRLCISALIAENYVAHLKDLSNKQGIQLSMEAIDETPFDEIYVAGQSDTPQTEFWYRRQGQPVGESGDFNPHTYRSYAWTPAMVSAAHIYGKKIASAEAFTAMPGENWQAHPALMKPQGDWAFCAGINRFIFHRYAMQPWVNRSPGMTMSYWGTHYERTQTWWEQTRPWHTYLTRCQYLLQNGKFVADILFMQAQAAPNRFIPPNADFSNPKPPDPPGYNFDGCTADVILNRVVISDGRIRLPDGMSYKLLVLPAAGQQVMAGVMTVELAKKIESLVNQGMIVLGPPPEKTPGLKNYPQSELELKQVIDRLWGDISIAGERTIGKGRVIWGRSPSEVLSSMNIPLDFSCGAGNPFRYIHRTAQDGSDLYFLSNKTSEKIEAECTFRIQHRRPELWDPESGEIQLPALYSSEDKVTSLPMQLLPFGSVFVVFRKEVKNNPNRIVKLEKDGRELINDISSILQIRHEKNTWLCLVAKPGKYTMQTENKKEYFLETGPIPPPLTLTGGWNLAFTRGWGAPAQIRFPELISWSEHSDPGIRFYSGKATYTKTIHIPAEMVTGKYQLMLDLGEVEVIAIVKLNGKELDTLWKEPFQADISAHAMAGENLLELTIINLWPNRLIGDEHLADDCEWSSEGSFAISSTSNMQTLKKYPQWLIDGKPSPTGRYTFSTIKVWNKEDKLLRSGLLGPVVLHSIAKATIDLAG